MIVTFVMQWVANEYIEPRTQAAFSSTDDRISDLRVLLLESRFDQTHDVQHLDDALRIAFTELVRWIHERYGLSEMDAYELLSKTAEIHLDEMVDPNYVIIAKINKKFLPPERNHK